MVPKRDLTDRTLKALKPADPGKRYFAWDAQIPGFGVRITDRSPPSVSFVLVARFPGAKNPAPRQIGDYPAVDLAKARQTAREWREDIAKGIDPKAKAKAAQRNAERLRANTFRAAFEAFADEHLSTLRTGAVVKRVVEKHVVPVFGDRPLSELTRADGKDLLRSLAKTTPIHANRICSYLHKFGVWAEDDERVVESPFATLRRPAKEVPRDRILSDQEIRAVWAAGGEMGSFGRVARFLLATAQRRCEVSDATWDEFDLAQELWRLPRERTKSNRAHVVPLSPLAIMLIAEAPRIGVHPFATRTIRGATVPISAWATFKDKLDALALAELRRIVGAEAEFPAWRLHDLRRTAATRMGKPSVDRLHISKVLNHSEKGVTGQVYDLYEYLPEKRRALERWGARLSAIVEGGDAGNIVHLPARG
jgi:integrase